MLYYSHKHWPVFRVSLCPLCGVSQQTLLLSTASLHIFSLSSLLFLHSPSLLLSHPLSLILSFPPRHGSSPGLLGSSGRLFCLSGSHRGVFCSLSTLCLQTCCYLLSSAHLCVTQSQSLPGLTGSSQQSLLLSNTLCVCSHIIMKQRHYNMKSQQSFERQSLY